MKIKDIVNRDIVNLTNCEHEPIHIPGSIQPHGFLIAFKKKDKRIDFCSANILSFTGLRHEQVLSKTIFDIFGDTSARKIETYLLQKAGSFAPPLTLEFNKNSYNISLHNSGDVTIMEFEPYDEKSPPLSDFYDQTREFVAYMEKTTSLQSLCQRVAEQTRTITGYDRVMIYRFDNDYNGEVFAESKRDNLEPFLGLHYPHTDIPAQARELYKLNLLRLIVDVGYTPVPLYTIDDAPNKNLNLGNASLRSVSPIHIQYLANIGVGATLTISLMHGDNLWGLIACHHYSPKYIHNFIRNAAQLQGHFITSQINVRQVAERHALTQNITGALDKMLGETYPLNREMFTRMAAKKELLELCNASGVTIFIDKDIFTGGIVPAEKDIRNVLKKLKSLTKAGTIQSNRLLDLYEDAEALRASAAGIIYHSMDDILNIGVIWFRSETLQEVKWAGDPNKAIIKDEKGLSPRKSFELWKEVIKLQSNPWTEPELSAASNFARNLERHTHLLFLSEEETKYKVLNEVLKETNAELENINWISTHDLKEPLRKIRLFGSKVLDMHGEKLNGSVIDSIKKMNNAASRMQTLISDILSYSKVRQNKDKLVDVDLNLVLQDVLQQFQEEGDEKNLTLTVDTMPTVKGIAFLLHQLFVNLLHNSIKFSRSDVSPSVTVRASLQRIRPTPSSPEGNFYAICVKDNGIGFEDQFSESIFNVFTRLHTVEYNGTGIGLALCKKIMQIHNGFIQAKGWVNEGAEFTLYFPASDRVLLNESQF